MRNNIQVLKNWIDSSFTKANAFVEELVNIFDRVSTVLDRTHVLMVVYDIFTYTKDFTIQRLQALMNIPRQTLVNGGVLKEGQAYDFHRWYNLLRMRKVMFKDISNRCNQIKNVTSVIHDRIVVAAETMLGKEMKEEIHIVVDQLIESVKYTFFGVVRSLSKSQLKDIQLFMMLAGKIQDFGPEWEKIFVTALAKLDIMEDQLNVMPNVPMDELDCIMSRFIEFASKETDKGNTLLDESLL